MRGYALLQEVLVRDALRRNIWVALEYIALQKSAASKGLAFEVVASPALERGEFPCCNAAPEFGSQELADFLTNLSKRPPKTAVICLHNTFAGQDMVIACKVLIGSEPTLQVPCVQAES